MIDTVYKVLCIVFIFRGNLYYIFVSVKPKIQCSKPLIYKKIIVKLFQNASATSVF